MRAVIGLRSLPADDRAYPKEVLVAAAWAQKLMCLLQSRNEEAYGVFRH